MHIINRLQIYMLCNIFHISFQPVALFVRLIFPMVFLIILDAKLMYWYRRLERRLKDLFLLTKFATKRYFCWVFSHLFHVSTWHIVIDFNFRWIIFRCAAPLYFLHLCFLPIYRDSVPLVNAAHRYIGSNYVPNENKGVAHRNIKWLF